MNERVIRSREEMHDILQMLRLDRRLTQGDVAERVGVATMTVSTWEGGPNGRIPNMENLVQLLDFYGYELVIREKR